MNPKNHPPARPQDPFNDSAVERQLHMGLLSADGTVDSSAIAACSKLYEGLFYDDLCDRYVEDNTALDICHILLERSAGMEARRVLLALSLQYDALCRALPDPVWWIAGNAALVQPFIDGFLQHLAELVCAGTAREEVR